MKYRNISMPVAMMQAIMRAKHSVGFDRDKTRGWERQRYKSHKRSTTYDYHRDSRSRYNGMMLCNIRADGKHR